MQPSTSGQSASSSNNLIKGMWRINSFLKWIGGKKHLSQKIVTMLPPHTCYVELFAGAAWVLFRKSPKISQVEVLNDYDGELMNLYKVVKHHHDEFVKQFRLVFVSRRQFDEFSNQDPSTLTDVQRAARFYYLLKMTFGSKLTSSGYGYSKTSKPSLRIDALPTLLGAVAERLTQVNIECLDFETCIEKYDCADSFFYVDPPYYKSDLYRIRFTVADHLRLGRVLSGVQGKFILSINDSPEIRELYKDYHITEEQVYYSIGSTGEHRGEFPELVINNFELQEWYGEQLSAPLILQ